MKKLNHLKTFETFEPATEVDLGTQLGNLTPYALDTIADLLTGNMDYYIEQGFLNRKDLSNLNVKFREDKAGWIMAILDRLPEEEKFSVQELMKPEPDLFPEEIEVEDTEEPETE